MYHDKKILAIIPARGGSKRLPRKNILSLAGKPLISWSIEAAKNSKFIDKVIVSTDDVEIAEISRAYGAIVPFLRPDFLSRDESSSIDVVLHAIGFLKEQGEIYDYVMLLQPTSPLRDTEEIDKSLKVVFENNASGVISVCESEHSPLWANTLPKNNSMDDFMPKRYLNARSQDLPLYYRLNGAVYISHIETLVQEKTFFLQEKLFAHIMSQEKSIDIDTKLDFLMAKLLMEQSVL